MPTTIIIPASRLLEAQRIVDRFARKAAKLNMSGPSLITERRFTRCWVVRRGDVIAGPFDGGLPASAPQGAVQSLDMVKILITGERPVIAGWRFAATIEATEAGNILRKHPDHATDLPRRFRSCESVCDHCGTNRRRKETFVVEQVHDGETHLAPTYLQVGRSCLRDFVGNADPAAWLAAMQFERSIRAIESDPDGMGGFMHSTACVPVATFLAVVAADIREHGYRGSASMSITTGQAALNGLPHKDPTERAAWTDAVTEADRELAKGALAWLASGEAGDSDYIHNCRAFVAAFDVKGRSANTLASLVQTYRKHLGVLAVRATKTNEHLPGAAVKQRLRGLSVTLVGEYSFDTDFGTKWILRFEDCAGRSIVWRTTNPPDMEVGQHGLLTGTVKALGEYKGTMQTEFSRCKVEVQGEVAAA